MVERVHFLAPVQDLDQALRAPSDDAVVELLAAAFARLPLPPDALRDAKLVAFLLDVESGRYASDRVADITGNSVPVLVDRLVRESGISEERVHRAMDRLQQAGALERTSLATHGQRVVFLPAVLQVAGSVQYVDWPTVLGVLSGRTPALLILRAVLDLTQVPWAWGSLTYDALALRACYSVGMAQRGVSQLLAAHVLERAVRTGRGHDYRLSPWALGRAPVPRDVRGAEPDEVKPPVSEHIAQQHSVGHGHQVRQTVPDELRPSATDVMAVEVGGLILRIPAGTEIRMVLGADGRASYEIGPDLRITKSR